MVLDFKVAACPVAMTQQAVFLSTRVSAGFPAVLSRPLQGDCIAVTSLRPPARHQPLSLAHIRGSFGRTSSTRHSAAL